MNSLGSLHTPVAPQEAAPAPHAPVPAPFVKAVLSRVFGTLLHHMLCLLTRPNSQKALKQCLSHQPL